MQPVAIMASFNSSFKISRTLSTPAWPSEDNPHKIGRPTNTKSAPSANAFKTSVPFLTPPSKKIGIFFPESLTALTISGKTSIVAGVVSNYLAPWLEQWIPSAPLAIASFASS